MTGSNFEGERQAVIDAIAEECAAFYMRDVEKWSTYWVHADFTQRLGTLAGGHLDYQRGWDEQLEMMARLMKLNPEPNPEAAKHVKRENIVVRISGDMAWASFDQYTPRTLDVFVNVGLTRQVRVFERHDGQWKVAFAGHGDTRVGYFRFPAVCLTRHGKVEWMNGEAKERLLDHPVLIESVGQLRCRHQDDDKKLRETVRDVADLTPIDIRSSLLPDSGNTSSIALVLPDRFEDRTHILWVAKVDGMVLVSFDDQEAEARTVAVAGTLYGLSASQVRLAGLIVKGLDLGKAAEEMEISVNTARTHLQRVFDKTGVRSQTALVRVLLSVVSPMS